MLRTALLAAARSPRLRTVVSSAPVTRPVVDRFVAGESLADVLTAVDGLVAQGLAVTVDHLGEDTTDAATAEATVLAYERLLEELARRGLARRAEVSVKLSAVGQALPGDGEALALTNARRICRAAERAGTTVTLDMEDSSTTDSTLRVLRALRQDFAWVGAVVQAALRRTEADCRELATAGSRVRLCKGAYAEPASVAFVDRDEVDASYRRCLAVLMAGDGYPMVASHDPAMVELAGHLATAAGRAADSWETQMLLGIRPEEQGRLVSEGRTVRVYVPYGQQWYGYFARRLAERPANLTFFLRSLATRG